MSAEARIEQWKNFFLNNCNWPAEKADKIAIQFANTEFNQVTHLSYVRQWQNDTGAFILLLEKMGFAIADIIPFIDALKLILGQNATAPNMRVVLTKGNRRLSSVGEKVDEIMASLNGCEMWADKAKTWLFYEKESTLREQNSAERKCCVTVINSRFAATFSHGTHKKLVVGSELEIRRECDEGYQRRARVIEVQPSSADRDQNNPLHLGLDYVILEATEKDFCSKDEEPRIVVFQELKHGLKFLIPGYTQTVPAHFSIGDGTIINPQLDAYQRDGRLHLAGMVAGGRGERVNVLTINRLIGSIDELQRQRNVAILKANPVPKEFGEERSLDMTRVSHSVKISDNTPEQSEQVRNYLNLVVQKQSRDASLIIGFSGGSMLEFLAPILASLPSPVTSRLHLFPVDERLVPREHEESNAGSLIRLLPKELASSVLTLDEADMDDGQMAAQKFELKLRSLSPPTNGDGFPVFDLLFLGMGPDGHTCSLFPRHTVLKASNSWISYIGDSPKPPPRRITVTIPVLNAAANVAFIANGGSKSTIIKKIIAESDPQFPPSLIAPANNNPIQWFVDKDAAKELPAL